MLSTLLAIGLLYMIMVCMVDTQVKTTTPFPYNNYKAHCPPFEITNPCNCTLFHGIDSQIKCDVSTKFNITETLQRISDHLTQTNEPDKHYTDLTLKNIAIIELPDQVLRGISFNEIYIENTTSLKRISSAAFDGSEKRTLKFYMEGYNAMSDSDYTQFFAALNSLINAKTITFLNHNIRLIPDRAFANNTLVSKTERLVFNMDGVSNRGTLASIGTYAFYGLKTLTYLNLAQQMISHIGSNAFEFADPSTETLRIYLNDNQLNASSFDLAAFTNTQRPIWLNLDNNKIDYLEEKVFRPLFAADQRNIVSLNGHSLNCADCRNVWLVKEKATLEKQTENMFCSGRSSDTIWLFNNFTAC